MPDQRGDGALGRGVGRQRVDPTMSDDRGQGRNAAPRAHDRQQLLDKEIGRVDIDGKQIVEIGHCGVLDRRDLRDAGIGHEDVQTIAHDGPDLLGEPVGPVGRGKNGGYGVGATASLADVGDHGLRLFGGAAVVDEDFGTGRGERQRAGAADATRRSGDEGGLVPNA